MNVSHVLASLSDSLPPSQEVSVELSRREGSVCRQNTRTTTTVMIKCDVHISKLLCLSDFIHTSCNIASKLPAKIPFIIVCQDTIMLSTCSVRLSVHSFSQQPCIIETWNFQGLYMTPDVSQEKYEIWSICSNFGSIPKKPLFTLIKKHL